MGDQGRNMSIGTMPNHVKLEAKKIGKSISDSSMAKKNEEIFLEEVEKLGNRQLLEICKQNIGILGIDNLGSFDEDSVRESARSFTGGFENIQKDHRDYEDALRTLEELNENLLKLDQQSRRELVRQIELYNKEKNFAEKLKQFIKEKIGVDLDNPMQSIMKKLGLGGKNDDKHKTKTESEEADDLLQLKTFSTFKGGMVGMIISPFILGGAAGAIIPIGIMFFPLLIAYDGYNAIKKSCGSPFAEGTFHNMIQSVEAGKSYGPTVVTNENFRGR